MLIGEYSLPLEYESITNRTLEQNRVLGSPSKGGCDGEEEKKFAAGEISKLTESGLLGNCPFFIDKRNKDLSLCNHC